jgi:hypothetical protein
MPDLHAEIARMTEVLTNLQSSTLVTENLARVLQDLQGNQVGRLLEEYARTLPTEPDDSWEKDAFRKDMAARADGINRTAENFLHELERIKRMRQTLNLDALDPIIHAARAIIHRIHDFTANLQDQ